MPDSPYNIDDLMYLMARLRKPVTGCPWDLEQNYRSIAPSTVEEVFEVVDAIERNNYGDLKEELGDLLFQVIFYAQLAAEEQRFDFFSIVDALCDKLIRRHPHVFPGGDLRAENTEENNLNATLVLGNWEANKQKERQHKGLSSLFDDVPNALPALLRAQKIQKRAAKVGFDWPDERGVIEKIEEEIREFEETLESGDKSAEEEELGDLLFACVNLVRKRGLDAEQSLRSATRKFEGRMALVEKMLTGDGREWRDCDAELLDDYWRRAKAAARPD